MRKVKIVKVKSVKELDDLEKNAKLNNFVIFRDDGYLDIINNKCRISYRLIR